MKKLSIENVKKLSKLDMKKITAGSGNGGGGGGGTGGGGGGGGNSCGAWCNAYGSGYCVVTCLYCYIPSGQQTGTCQP